MTLLTGDTHGRFDGLLENLPYYFLAQGDTIVILGDVGLNYYLNKKDTANKQLLSNPAFPFTFFCIHGNHEARPQTIETYKEKIYLGGRVLFEEEFPNIVFPIDGEVFNFPEGKAIVIGGAYSVDKHYRLTQGMKWFADEQPSDEIKATVEEAVRTKTFDYVLSHTCPYKYIPREWFISQVDQSTVDNGTEMWLNSIEGIVEYKKWYRGHYHGGKIIDKMVFMYKDIRVLGR